MAGDRRESYGGWQRAREGQRGGVELEKEIMGQEERWRRWEKRRGGENRGRREGGRGLKREERWRG